MKYERLTIRNSDGSVSQPTHSTFYRVFNRLAELEDKIENGMLIELKDRKPLMWGKDGDTVHCQHCGEDLMGVFYGETEIIQCPKCGGFVDGLIAEGYNEAKLKELQNG